MKGERKALTTTEEMAQAIGARAHIGKSYLVGFSKVMLEAQYSAGLEAAIAEVSRHRKDRARMKDMDVAFELDCVLNGLMALSRKGLK